MYLLTSKYVMVTLYRLVALFCSILAKRSERVRAMIPGSPALPNIVYVLPAPERERERENHTLTFTLINTHTCGSVSEDGGIVPTDHLGDQSLRGLVVDLSLASPLRERHVKHVAVVLVTLRSQYIITVSVWIHQNHQLQNQAYVRM